VETIYPLTRAAIGHTAWTSAIAPPGAAPGCDVPQAIEAGVAAGRLPPFAADLARLESQWNRTLRMETPSRSDLQEVAINPTLGVVKTAWRVSSVFASEAVGPATRVDPGEEWCLMWRHPDDGALRFRTATADDLLVLKIVSEGMRREDVAAEHRVPIGAIDRAFSAALRAGLLLAPASDIRRSAERATAGEGIAERFLVSNSFTLQWHITNSCDLRCRHCYDRTLLSPLDLEQGIAVLDSLREFCLRRHVQGHVCFTGGNPFLHGRFEQLYAAAAERGFNTSILGNPTPRDRLERLCAIQKPSYFQVSLEGLQPHNDYMRGNGHFDRTLDFLDVLAELRIPSQVMLTLTRDNMGQVLPLAELLRGRVDDFTFNRLAQVGEGANLAAPDPAGYARFLEEYVDACARNPVLALKDNLLNVVHDAKRLPLFGGCTGHGCGAAFNFIALLPDGEAHACRKFPSPIGNVLEQGIGGVYDSGQARRYRDGCSACQGCRLRPVCGSCMAVTYGRGEDPLTARDPQCLFNEAPPALVRRSA
jgi:selenobiotic family peptide radical SAM maturase